MAYRIAVVDDEEDDLKHVLNTHKPQVSEN